jgi:hypothetical protein
LAAPRLANGAANPPPAWPTAAPGAASGGAGRREPAGSGERGAGSGKGGAGAQHLHRPPYPLRPCQCPASCPGNGNRRQLGDYGLRTPQPALGSPTGPQQLMRAWVLDVPPRRLLAAQGGKGALHRPYCPAPPAYSFPLLLPLPLPPNCAAPAAPLPRAAAPGPGPAATATAASGCWVLQGTFRADATAADPPAAGRGRRGVARRFGYWL